MIEYQIDKAQAKLLSQKKAERLNDDVIIKKKARKDKGGGKGPDLHDILPQDSEVTVKGKRRYKKLRKNKVHIEEEHHEDIKIEEEGEEEEEKTNDGGNEQEKIEKSPLDLNNPWEAN